MAPVFIFAKQIQNIANSGKKSIEIAEEARISPAAADLIKAHGLEVKIITPDKSAKKETSVIHNEATNRTSKTEQSKAPGREVNEIKVAAAHNDISEVSDDDLEEIINRVLARFRQIKHAAGEKADAQQSSQTTPAGVEPVGGDDLVICRCEEITRTEIKTAIRNGMHTLNGVKRVTRAGMGLCQGQTCQQLVARILVEELGIGMDTIVPTTARGPVRPLRLSVFANS